MCDQSKPGNHKLNRRDLLKGALAGGLLGGGLLSFAGVSFAAALTRAERDAMSPEQVIEMLEAGNQRFRSGRMRQYDYLAQKRASASGQYPAAAILSCIDSRTPAEILLDTGLGEVFNTRIAGNICNAHIVGSLEFACAVAGAKVILVVGHTACGAVKGAIDEVQLGALSGLLEEIRPAIAATEYAGERTGENAEFVDLVAASNVRRSIAQIRAGSELLSQLENAGKIQIVGAMYHLEGGRLRLLE